MVKKTQTHWVALVLNYATPQKYLVWQLSLTEDYLKKKVPPYTQTTFHKDKILWELADYATSVCPTQALPQHRRCNAVKARTFIASKYILCHSGFWIKASLHYAGRVICPVCSCWGKKQVRGGRAQKKLIWQYPDRRWLLSLGTAQIGRASARQSSQQVGSPMLQFSWCFRGPRGWWCRTCSLCSCISSFLCFVFGTSSRFSFLGREEVSIKCKNL